MKTAEVKSRAFDSAAGGTAASSAAKVVEAGKVEKFIRKHKLREHLKIASSLISKHFPSVGEVVMEKREDPEFDDEWLTLGVRASRDVDSVLEAYDRLTRDLAVGLPPEVSSKIRISLQRA